MGRVIEEIMAPAELREAIWGYYAKNGRSLPWREPDPNGVFDPYKILVSEMMLQQTQVQRVIPKYQQFLGLFPTLQLLAAAPLSDVLVAWSGLGYNRRAQYLHLAAKKLAGLRQPWRLSDLTACKGIGLNTAAAVLVYAYNQPLVFVETNIRTVLIYYLLPNRTDVVDKELVPLMESVLDAEHPREFYWAVMDYGSHLKATVGNASRASKHHLRQSKFNGSKRQIRGTVLRALRDGAQTYTELAAEIKDDRLQEVLTALEHEKLVTLNGLKYHLG
jgi:A/G-specific adenine glycosylase